MKNLPVEEANSENIRIAVEIATFALLAHHNASGRKNKFVG